MAKNLKKSRTFRFTEEEMALMDRVKGEKTYAQIIVEGLQALDRPNEISQETVLDWIRRNTKE
ncbi:MAG: hypothetical protein AAFY82_00245 [Pseudomonadota bacterium]